MRPATREPWVVRSLLIALALAWLALVVVAPLATVFGQALSRGWPLARDAVMAPDAIASVRLTLLIAVLVVPFNLVFGVAAAWLVAKHDFRGKNALVSLIDLPFSISPVVAGLMYVLLFGAQGWFGGFLASHNIRILFAVPGIFLATALVTLPYIARQIIPLMTAQGRTEEEAAVTLGAGGFQILWHVTLPNIRWGLLYGVLLTNARAMGEFGAVSVVSGHIRGLTNTMPLHVQALYDGYDFVGAFAVASLLACLGLLTLAIKMLLEWRHRDALAATATWS